jgi:hypothetical protein
LDLNRVKSLVLESYLNRGRAGVKAILDELFDH